MLPKIELKRSAHYLAISGQGKPIPQGDIWGDIYKTYIRGWVMAENGSPGRPLSFLASWRKVNNRAYYFQSQASTCWEGRGWQALPGSCRVAPSFKIVIELWGRHNWFCSPEMPTAALEINWRKRLLWYPWCPETTLEIPLSSFCHVKKEMKVLVLPETDFVTLC